jgi:hypothetical protein
MLNSPELLILLGTTPLTTSSVLVRSPVCVMLWREYIYNRVLHGLGQKLPFRTVCIRHLALSPALAPKCALAAQLLGLNSTIPLTSHPAYASLRCCDTISATSGATEYTSNSSSDCLPG